jgi:RimJ/RimL family protein N-acetyltransferase
MTESWFTAREGRSVQLRQARPDDAAAILDYLRRVGVETPYLTFGAEGVPLSEEEERSVIGRYAAMDNALFLLAVAAGEVVGTLTFEGGNRPRTRHVGEFGVSVAAELHGQGIGRRLVEALIAWAREGGIVRKINLRVRVDNPAAIALYRHLGFETEGQLSRDVLVDGEFYDVIAMGLEIDP